MSGRPFRASGDFPRPALRLLARLVPAALIVWGGFLWLTEEVFEGDTRSFDRGTLLWLGSHYLQWLRELMLAVTFFGYYRIIAVLLVICVALFLWRRWRFEAALLATSALGGMILTTLLKEAFKRHRPDIIHSGYHEGSFSYPSGHATMAVGFYLVLAVLVASHLRGGYRLLVVALGVVFALLLGFSRVYLGVHYPTDIIAGYLSSPLLLVFLGLLYALARYVRSLVRAAKNAAGD